MNPKRIIIQGAREHNLKNIHVEIPRDQLVVVTGLSGSGKSTLAFDTVYAEGQRKYVESLSAYARQFLEQLKKPDIDEIQGLPPTIAIEQRSASSNPRSIVATTTEIHDYLRVLFARAGKACCKECGRPISGTSPSQIVDAVMSLPENTRLMILSPLIRGQKGEHKEVFAGIHRQGFVRARVDGQILDLADPTKPPTLAKTKAHQIEAVVDRIVIKSDARSRLADSVETAVKLSQGLVIICRQEGEKWIDQVYSEKFACPEHPESALEELEPRIFSFNSPHGACPLCHGLGMVFEFDPDLVVPDTELSLSEGAVVPWRASGKGLGFWYNSILRDFCGTFDVSYRAPYKTLPKTARDVLLYGTEKKGDMGTGAEFEGVLPNLQRRYDNTDSDWVKMKLQGFLSEQPCKRCEGKRLKPEVLAVRIESTLPIESKDPVLPGQSIHDVITMTVDAARTYFENLKLTAEGKLIAEPLIKEIKSRLTFLADVGLGYLTLDRKTGSLSGGEAQRIRLATQVGSGLVGVCYVLDEPTIGLHQRDNDRLITTLRKLQSIGNTVIVVEHDEDCIRHADHLIDVGPGAGEHGGKIVCQGDVPEIFNFPDSVTMKYLRGELAIETPKKRRKLDPAKEYLEIKGCRENNLKNIDVRFPLKGMICITGVSGSGKSTLVNQTLLPALKRQLTDSRDIPGQFKKLEGAQRIDKVIEIDQTPIGRTPRSNPVTYTGVFDDIRKVFAATREAKLRGYEAGRFSFNVKGGRCEACQGQGSKCVEMHFLPDVYVDCEVCKGARYNAQTLEIHYRGKNISDVLNMTVEEALGFFENFSKISQMLKCLLEVGLGYVRIGQPSTQLSGGEAQRVKLASELGKSAYGHTLYILDEPTTGLHFADIHNLLNVLNRLADMGHTILVIEHNLDVIKCADWIIDMGPEGGHAGGTVIAQGTPEEIARSAQSYTGRFLKHKLNING